MNKTGVVVAGVVVVAVAGCGASSSTTGKPHAGGSSPSAAVPALNGEQAKPAQQVLADAKSALFNAQAVHVKGSQTQQGKTQTIDVQLQGEDSAGTIGAGGVSLNIVKTAGKVYVKAPEQFWAKRVGTAVAPKLANRWLVQDAAMAGNVSGITLQGIAASLNAADTPLKPGVATGQLNGQRTVVLTQQDGSTLVIAGTGAPLPLELTGGGATRGTLTFTGYGKNQTITAPPGAVSAQQAAKAPSAGTA